MKTPPANSFATTARWLFFYGTFLFCVALAAVMYDPKSGQFGFNTAAKTALISGGVCGGLSILWSLLLSTGARWPLWAALGSTGLFLAAFAWRSTVSWSAYSGGATEKWYAATLITMMALASLAVFLRLLRALFSPRKTNPRPVAIPTGPRL
jgi:uncharacterized membrane protein (UPF0136 family)